MVHNVRHLLIFLPFAFHGASCPRALCLSPVLFSFFLTDARAVDVTLQFQPGDPLLSFLFWIHYLLDPLSFFMAYTLILMASRERGWSKMLWSYVLENVILLSHLIDDLLSLQFWFVTLKFSNGKPHENGFKRFGQRCGQPYHSSLTSGPAGRERLNLEPGYPATTPGGRGDAARPPGNGSASEKPPHSELPVSSKELLSSEQPPTPPFSFVPRLAYDCAVASLSPIAILF